jgi:hypothetical protein
MSSWNCGLTSKAALSSTPSSRESVAPSVLLFVYRIASDIAAEREEQDDPEAVEPTELLRRQYVEGATADQKARFHRLNPADQENELRDWKLTNDRMPDDSPVSSPLGRRMAARRTD